MKTIIKQVLSGVRGEISSKRVSGFVALATAIVGFFCNYTNFEPFLIFAGGMFGVSIFEKK